MKYPEDIVVNDQGSIYTGLEDGRLISISPQGEKTELYHHLDSGMILGIILNAKQDKLYYVTEFKGLIEFDLHKRQPIYLIDEIQGRKLQALNSLCLDETNNIIYMTESTSFPLKFAGKDLILKRKSGRILSYDIQHEEGKVILQDLAYPNGIVFNKVTKEIIFSQLTHHSISAYPVYADNPRKKEIITNLFGYPDNLKLNEKGQLYVGIPAVRDPNIEYLNQNPWVRKQFLYIPDSILELLTQNIAGGIKINLENRKITEYIFGNTEKNNKLSKTSQYRHCRHWTRKK